MTGFGKFSSETTDKKITVEVRSLNSKSLDLNVRIPYIYKEKEIEFRKEAGSRIERGKVDISVYIEEKNEPDELVEEVNKEQARRYYEELKVLSQELNEPDLNLLSRLLKKPQDTKSDAKKDEEFDEEVWNQIMSNAEKAIEDFQQYRIDEGKTLEQEFNKRINNLNTLLQEVINNDAARIENIRSRILTKVEELVEKSQVDNNRFEQELIYYIEKLDITEEKVRLQTHLDYFLKIMKEVSGGRKLGFITQEIGREINTIGSKSNDAVLQKLVVQMKDELEKIKEQLLNVL